MPLYVRVAFTITPGSTTACLGDLYSSSARARATPLASLLHHTSLPIQQTRPITWHKHSSPLLALSALLGFTTLVAGLLMISDSLSPFPQWLLASKGFPLVTLLSAFLSLQATKTLLLKGPHRFCLSPSLLSVTGQRFPAREGEKGKEEKIPQITWGYELSCIQMARKFLRIE